MSFFPEKAEFTQAIWEISPLNTTIQVTFYSIIYNEYCDSILANPVFISFLSNFSSGPSYLMWNVVPVA